MTYITIGIPAAYVIGGTRSAAVRRAREIADNLAMFPNGNEHRARLKRVQREDLDAVGPLAMWVYCDGDSRGKVCRQLSRAEFIGMVGPVFAGEA